MAQRFQNFYNSIKKNGKANTELNQLYKKPVPESKKYMPQAQIFHPDVYYQGDVLYMPEDKGFKYMVVITDMYDGSIDAQPIKDVNKDDVLKAIKTIYNNIY